MPRLPLPSDTEAFTEETRAAVRHILKTRSSMPPPSSDLTYAGKAGAAHDFQLDDPAPPQAALTKSSAGISFDYTKGRHNDHRFAGTRL
jgi:hypothetical protein